MGDGKESACVQLSRAAVYAAIFVPLCISVSLLPVTPVEASTTSEMYRTKAVFPIAERDYAAAMQLLNRAVEADDKDAQAWYYRGVVHSRIRDYDMAVRDTEAASALGFSHPDLYEELGYAYFRLQQYREAASAFEQALAERPAQQRSEYYLGLSRFRLAQYEQAVPLLQQVAQAQDDMGMAAQFLLAEAYYHLKRSQQAHEQLKALFARDGSSRFFSYRLFPYSSIWSGTDAELARSRANFDVAAKDFSPALALLQQSLDSDPQDAHSRYYHGLLLSRSGKYREAIADFKQAEQTGFPHPELQQELGVAYYGKGDYSKAIKPLKQARNSGRNPAASGYYLAASYYQLKQYPDALRVLENTPRTDASLNEATDYLQAETLYRMKRSDEARRMLQRLLAGNPGPEYAEKAQSLLAKVEREPAREGRFQLELSAGFLRDSNVGLYPNDAVLPSTIDDRADNRWQLSVDGKWKPVLAEGTPLTLGYRFFQSLHQRLDQYNLRHHDVSVDWHKELKDFAWGVNYQYILASLDNERYVTTQQVMPNLMLHHGQQRLSLLKFTWRNDQYDYPGLDAYDGNRYEAQYRHYWTPADMRYQYLGALYRRENTEDTSLAFNGMGVEAGMLSSWQDIRFTADLRYLRKQYPDAPSSRDDDYYKLDLTMTYPLTHGIYMDVSASHIENQTDVPVFDYSRTLYGMTLRWKL